MESQLVKRPKRVPFAVTALGKPKWEELVHSRQFSYEWQGKDLQDGCRRLHPSYK